MASSRSPSPYMDPRNEKLIKSTKERRLHVVTECIQNGANINCVDVTGNTPLAIASMIGSQDIVDYFLTLKPLINHYEMSHEFSFLAGPPLVWAARQPHLSIVKSLVEAGADINLIDAMGYTALERAVCLGNVSIVQYLAENNASISKFHKDGNPPLIEAVQRRSLLMVECLLSYGADPNIRDGCGRSSLDIAVQKKNITLIEILLCNGAEPSVQSALLVAVQTGNLKIVQLLKVAGADINLTYPTGHTLLTKAIELGHVDIASYLTDNGANIDFVKNGTLNSCFHKYVANSNFEMVKYLVGLKLDLNFVRDDHFTPLTKCVEMENFELVKYLVENGADVNFADGFHRAPLKIAVSNGYFRIGTFLMDKGADVGLVEEELEDFRDLNPDFGYFF